MNLGEKLRMARQEAGLSQRQLCGDAITRNMLSQIEHGTARPSMDTLQYLASRLGKPVSWFLNENTVVSVNQQIMADARKAYDTRAYAAAWQILSGYRSPDEIYDRECALLKVLVLSELAEQARQAGKLPYARELLDALEAARQAMAYPIPELDRRCLLLRSRIPGADLADICENLPYLDEDLLLRAEKALNQHQPNRAAEYLAAAEIKDSPRWHLLMGKAEMARKRFAPAASHLQQAESVFPQACWPMLEACFRELGDFRQAYLYACKQR